ncbi:MAG: hypothetical protein HKO57_03325, partial [Akkermansiaceae bacterium]|nr:hypothetical protein [Akkermansiaceae bacterium]
AYVPAATGSGDLTVVLQPGSLANPANPVEARSQWRLLGESDADWKDSGTTLGGLVPGDYVIEAKPVAGRTTPSPITVEVLEARTATGTVTYFLAESPLGRLPRVLPFADVSVTEVLPYPFAGQLRSDAGLSSGFVVRPKVVATVGHAVFDDGTLQAATGLEWRFQRQAGVHEPVPQIPRGFYLLTGYEAQREADDSPGTSTPQSQTLDAATLYFPEDAGRGGFSGFLASDAIENEFLVSTAPMTLVGYPVDGTTGTNLNRMHATPIGPVTFTPAFGETYTTSGISSTGGNSGGPLCVLHPTGSYYPAAIYLGGTAQTVVRAIDSDVVNLIGFAEASGDAGIGGAGGMITDQAVTDISPAVLGSLRVIIEPAAARAAGAGWRISSQGAYLASGTRLDDLNPNLYGLSFATVPGFQPPAAPAVTVTGGELLTVTFTYAEIVPPPVITSESEVLVTRGEFLDYQIAAAGAESFAVLGDLPPGVSLDPLTGAISGTPEEAGRFEVTMRAANSGGADSRPLAIVSAPTLTLLPDTITVAVNTPVNYQVMSDDVGPGLVFGPAAGGLPSGVSLDPSSGLLTGTPDVAGAYVIPITATINGATATADLTLNVTGTAPAITRDLPPVREVEFGLTTTLAVQASGTPAPGFQWFEVDGTTATLIDGATAASFTTPPVTAPVRYRARAVSISGSADSTVSQIVVRPSTNPNLADLVVNASLFEPVLSPRFNPSILSYTASVPHFVSSVTVAPTPQIAPNAQSAIEVNGVALTGPESDSLPLTVGANAIPVVVTAGDGNASRSYSVTITRRPAPTQQTEAVTDITDVSATLNASVVPNGPAAVFFQYGPAGTFAESTSPVLVSGGVPVPVQAPLMDLIGGTDYQFRLAIQTPGGTIFGDTGTFTTLTPRPLTAVGDPSGVTTAQATFIGAVDPQGRDFDVFFEWGLDNSYDNTTPPQQVLAINGIQEVTATVTGLIEGREYCYRLVAAQGGQVFTVSQAVAFTPTTVPGGTDGMADNPPDVTTGAAQDITPTSATLLGTVNPNDGTTFVRFEYGLTPGYGRTT